VDQDFRELLEAFERFGVRFLVIGGHAVIKYTEPRYTKDLDLWIANDAENARKVFEALEDFGAPLVGLTAPDLVAEDHYFSMGTPPSQVDIWPTIPGVEFDGCWNRRTLGTFFGNEVYFISRGDLILNKETVGRLQDLADAEKLRNTE